MTNSIERSRQIICEGGSVCDMYDRIKQSRDVIDQAIKTRRFFSDGWFRLWRKNPLNKKVNRRDNIAFGELRWLQTTTT
jgi:hypothetical protein